MLLTWHCAHWTLVCAPVNVNPVVEWSKTALVQLIAGVLLLGSAVFPESAKVGLALFGVVLLAWGIVIAADTVRLFSVWGYSRSTGVLYIVIGAVLLVAAAFSPIFFSRRRQVVSGQGQQIDRGYSRV